VSGGHDDHPVAPPAVGIPLGPPDLIRGGPQRIPRPPDWRLGDPAPWLDSPVHLRRPTLATVRAALAETLRTDPPPATLEGGVRPERSSAVLIALYEHDTEPHVLLTRRSWSLRAHRGEVSFPGGREEPGDTDLVATALRESAEEVGIAPAEVEIIGRLDPLSTVSSRSLIVPYVGIMPELPDVEPDPREVEEIRHVALAELLTDGVYREERWRRGDIERPIWFFELHGDTVWGATASMLRQLLCFVTGCHHEAPPPFPEPPPDPT
jgi:8-oxo-dGTP pyrophosphatase MutT (NUDIX family)